MRKCLITRSALILCAMVFSFGVAPESPKPVSAQTSTGTIAYVVGNDTTGDEIWLVEADGSQNRKIYSLGVPDPYGVHSITGLAWRPDGGELAFTSDHEDYCSWYSYDVYAILPNGSGYRRMTNGPACADLAAYPQGTVTLDTVDSSGYQIYIQGAPSLKFAYGSSLTFQNVADLGNTLQPIVIIEGNDRWMSFGLDVTAGQTVRGVATPYTTGTDEIGAFNAVWRSDGSRLGYAFGCAGLRGIADYPKAGDNGQPLLSATGVFPCLMAWGPTAGSANDILYFTSLGNPGIYRTTENGGVGTRVVEMQEWDHVFQIGFLPDASGFIYSYVTGSTSSDLFRYDLQSDTITQLTFLSNEYARDFAISPDGKSIVFERAPEQLLALWGGASDLWIMGIDGSNPRLLVAEGAHPTWSERAIDMQPGVQAIHPFRYQMMRTSESTRRSGHRELESRSGYSQDGFK